MKTGVLELANGITLLYRVVPHSHVVHCGYVVDAGSRDETETETGMAHFIEHMLFKGTQRRKTFHILNYLEAVGGDLNAWTTREKTCIYASLAPEFLPRAFDLLTDILFHSTFPEAEILRERQVIAEEIEMYRDSPEESLQEQFDSLCFPDHPLGRPIAGSPESIASFQKPDFEAFTARHYTAGRIVFTVAGRITEAQVRRLAARYLAPVQVPPQVTRSRTVPPPQPRTHTETFASQQTHQIIGGRAYALRQEGYLAFSLLQNLLGGPAMNSLLNFRIREKYGLTYNLYAFYTPLTDTGNWGVYYACDPARRQRIEAMIHRELRLLREHPLSTLRLHQAQRQLAGQIILSQENFQGRALVSAQNWLDFGRDWEIPELLAQIQGITAAQVQDAAQELLDPAQLTTLTFLPEED